VARLLGGGPRVAVAGRVGGLRVWDNECRAAGKRDTLRVHVVLHVCDTCVTRPRRNFARAAWGRGQETGHSHPVCVSLTVDHNWRRVRKGRTVRT
jgi:hypothetical protein